MEASHQGWKRWLVAMGGILAFVAVGVAVLPALARYQRTPGSEAGVPGEGDAAEIDSRPPETESEELPLAAASDLSPPPPIDGLLDFDCMIAPAEVVEIGSSITGLISEITVERADYVETDQVVARLESSVEHATVRLAEEQARRNDDIESSKANLLLQKKRRSRARKLFNGRSLSVEAKDQVETEALLAHLDVKRARNDHHLKQLQLAQAQAALDRHTIRSPISGYVVDRRMSPGEVVDEETILRIAQVDPLRVEVILPAAMFGRIEPGMRAEVFAEASGGKRLMAEVEIVDRVIDGPSGTFGARLGLPNPDQSVPAGLRCQVRFLEEEPEMLARA
ncbi:MAG: efflux RND transporter periplasmic adaptor subunit, partial [Deltaproteobacteria bacterium]|nr:efflux RND transporter periplasmic adaptor subunit [Deltaproteobacteria bacterium]